MKKMFAVLVLLIFVTTMNAKGLKSRALVEVGPKASLYMGSVAFGLGAEIVVNPLKNIGCRIDVTELHFNGGTSFYLNQLGSLDALIYIPMQKVETYLHAGLGIHSVASGTDFSIRGGMGFNYYMKKGLELFVEPGIILTGVSVGDFSHTDVMFRLSVGAKFPILR